MGWKMVACSCGGHLRRGRSCGHLLLVQQVGSAAFSPGGVVEGDEGFELAE